MSNIIVGICLILLFVLVSVTVGVRVGVNVNVSFCIETSISILILKHAYVDIINTGISTRKSRIMHIRISQSMSVHISISIRKDTIVGI